jgi:geranylgeranyl diphosphate synthase type II
VTTGDASEHGGDRTDEAPIVDDATDRLSSYLQFCHGIVLEEIGAIVPDDHASSGGLYGLMLDYPLRGGKALRPALCIATCRAFEGSLHRVRPSAAVLELYHNAFLIHDDIEDGSELRRQEATLHRLHGVPIAVHVGDGMLALALRPLLDNIRHIGLGPALRVLQCVADMVKESAEGQMLELAWIRDADWMPSERDYVRMVHKKSAWYTFVAPVTIGAVIAGVDDATLRALRRFATALGVAFQIQDDVLNLEAGTAYGKELAGDLWEGKHTLILAHALRHAGASDRERALATLARPRPGEDRDVLAKTLDTIAALDAAGALPAEARERLVPPLEAACGRYKSEADVAHLKRLVDAAGSIPYAREAARRRVRHAARTLDRVLRRVAPSPHRDFLEDLVDFVVHRDH